MPAHIKKALHQLQQDHFFHSVRIKRLERNIFTLWGDLIAGPFSCEWHGFSDYSDSMNEQEKGVSKPRWGLRTLLRKLPQSVKNPAFYANYCGTILR